MCDCIKKTTESARKQLVAKVEQDNTVSEWVQEGIYQNIGYSLDGGITKIGMPFILQYYKQKKDGKPEKNMTTKYVTVYPSYCAFCGEKF